MTQEVVHDGISTPADGNQTLDDQTDSVPADSEQQTGRMVRTPLSIMQSDTLAVQQITEELRRARRMHEPMNSPHEAYAVIWRSLTSSGFRSN